MLDSDLFANADRASRFLRYVVGRTLDGEGDQLKEFVIGVDVFDRGDDYDPRIDSIVRVEAGRLRAKLDQYYSRATTGDAVVIRMPRGAYVPEFERREIVGRPGLSGPPVPRRAAMEVAAALFFAVVLAWGAGLGPSRGTSASAVAIAVLPFQHFSAEAADQLLAARVTDGVTSELARVEGLSVISRTSAVQLASQGRTLREVARALDADVVVEGSVIVEAGQVHLDVRLVDTAIDRKRWVRRFAADISDLRGLEQRAAAAVAAAIRDGSASRSTGARPPRT